MNRIAAGAIYDATREWVEVSGQVLNDGRGVDGVPVTGVGGWGAHSHVVTGALGSFGLRLAATRDAVGASVIVTAGDQCAEFVVR